MFQRNVTSHKTSGPHKTTANKPFITFLEKPKQELFLERNENKKKHICRACCTRLAPPTPPEKSAAIQSAVEPAYLFNPGLLSAAKTSGGFGKFRLRSSGPGRFGNQIPARNVHDWRSVSFPCSGITQGGASLCAAQRPR